MNGQPDFWFPVKRYGWGWGTPVRWQGWLVLAAYAALLIAAVSYFKAQRDVLGLATSALVLTGVLVVIIAVKGERPLRWRWGGGGR
jgi:drug/metabolite transporter (DMT)-like permease